MSAPQGAGAPRPFRVMGIVNATPDSFSDGGAHADVEAAVAHGLRLAEQGAAVLDVGGESTRPGAEPVPAALERERVVPVVARLHDALGDRVVLSIDTMKASVAEAALDAGATYVNDVTAGRDPDMLALVADRGAALCLVHLRGEPRTMQDDPRYDGDVVDVVRAFLAERVQAAVDAGVPEDRIEVDPGIGFGKALEHNLALVDRLDELCTLGPPVLFGASRKGFLGRLTGLEAPAQRDHATVGANVVALVRGARTFRVHDVRATHDALTVAAAILSS